MNRHVGTFLLTLLSIAAVLFVTGTKVRTQAAPAYGVTDLGTLGGSMSFALGISDGGLPSVAGYAMTGTQEFHAFSGTAGGIRDIGTLGGSRSEARASLNGSAVGVSEIADGNTHAFLSPGYGPMTDLGTLGGSASVADGIAAVGSTYLIVGSSQTAGNAAVRPFAYDTTAGVMTELPISLGGVNATAKNINAKGHIVGFADLPGGTRRDAFLYADGVTLDLGSLGYGSEAYAVNAGDVVVGRSWGEGGVPNHAFRYEGGAMQDLGTLGGNNSEAKDVADDGTIVGWADDVNGGRRAFIWRDGVMTDLNTLIPQDSGWLLVAATGINNRGAIVGYGYHGTQPVAFVLTPPIDLRVDLRVHNNLLDTNFPNPHEAGQLMTMGVTVYQNPTNPVFMATGVTVIDTLTGPVEILSWYGDGMQSCVQDGLQLTCRIKPVDFGEDLMIRVRATGPGVLTHTATVTADQPDPNPANNTASQSNTAVSLASLVVSSTTIVGGQASLSRATLTSPTPIGGATVHLASSNPAVASVPAQFDVLPGCCDGGLWREFYVTTTPVSAPVNVDISASYGLVTKVVPITVVPAGGTFPYGGTPWPIPGTIQAENYDVGGEGLAYHDLDGGNNGGAYRTDDVDLEPTGDAGGGANVGWTGGGEWLAYTVNVANAGSYTMDARVASLGSAGTFHVEVDGGDVTGPIAVPDTGGWQSWITVSRTVALPTGTHVLRVRYDSVGANGTVGNLNYLRFSTAGTSTPFGGAPVQLPGTIEAENFDEGGEAIAYHDDTGGNSGGEYRATDVDIQSTSDAGGGHNVGWIHAGEWLAYSVNITSSGSYTLAARVASPGQGGTFHVAVDGLDKTGPMSIPDTGGWQSWTTVSKTVSLDAGAHLLRVEFDTNGVTGAVGNLNFVRLTAAGGGSTPFGGTPWPIPGTIQAENFDDGGESVAYHDDTTGNSGASYRATDVDVQPTADTDGGYNVGWIHAGEWLAYTVNVAVTGTYTLDALVASPGTGGTFHVEVDGVDRTGSMAIPDTGGWQSWKMVPRLIALTSGAHVLRVVFDTNGVTGAVGNLGYLRFYGSGIPTPFGGTPAAVPGRIEAENFDNGVQGVAYFETTSGNLGGEYRATDVDVQTTTDIGGGYNVGWIKSSEWLNYTVSVAQGGVYMLTARVAAYGPGGTFHVEFDGVDRTGPLVIPDTGDWQSWVDVTASVSVGPGVQWMRFVADTPGPTGVFGNLNYIDLDGPQ